MKLRLLFAIMFAVAVIAGCDSKGTEQDYFDYTPKSAEIPAEGGVFEITISTNVDYHCEVYEDWIYEIASSSDNVHRFKVKPNASTEERSASISLCTNELCNLVRIYQLGAEDPESGDNGNGDNENGDGNGNDNGDDNGNGGDDNNQAGEFDWSSSFKHRSLALRITADWCGACPYLASSFEAAKTVLSGDLEIISLHAEGGLTYSASYNYFVRYNCTGYPTGVVDSRGNIPNYTNTSFTANIVKNVSEETVSAYSTKTGIAISSSVQGRKVTAEVSVYVKEAADYKVYALLLEDDIIGFQNGGGDNYEHDHVARVPLSSSSGDAMNISTANTIWTKTYTADVPTSYNLSNMKVIVFVEKPYGSRAKVGNVSYVDYQDYGDTYVDNSRSVKVGVTGNIEIL